MTSGGEGHADHAQGHASYRALKGDGPHPAADAHELVDVLWKYDAILQ
jgi:hypothetical protein